MLLFGASLVYEYVRRARYYRRLLHTLEGLEQKYYITELMETADFAEAEILADVLQQTTKAMNDTIAKQNIASREYKEYIETWIHEVKITISVIQLLCENHRSDVMHNISAETQRVDGFVEQALFLCPQ